MQRINNHLYTYNIQLAVKMNYKIGFRYVKERRGTKKNKLAVSARKHYEIYIKSIVSQPIHARLLQPMTNTWGIVTGIEYTKIRKRHNAYTC